MRSPSTEKNRQGGPALLTIFVSERTHVSNTFKDGEMTMRKSSIDKTKLIHYLYQNQDKLMTVLDILGFHGFHVTGDYLRCALPGKNNVTSVAINVGDESKMLLQVDVFSEDIYGDIYDLVMYIHPEWGFSKCLRKIKQYCQIETHEIEAVNTQTMVKKADKKEITLEEIDEVEIQSYSSLSTDLAKKYGLREIEVNQPEHYSWKLLIPHYSYKDKNKLVGYNVRTICFYDWGSYRKKSKPPKYKLRSGYHKSLNLFALSHNTKHIFDKQELIIFEGEKSVMWLDTFYDFTSNGIAVCTNSISNRQAQILGGIGKNFPGIEIVVALDKNVTEANIKEVCAKLSEHGCGNVSYIIDRSDLLNDKDAPVDQGREVWERLYEQRTPYFE